MNPAFNPCHHGIDYHFSNPIHEQAAMKNITTSHNHIIKLVALAAIYFATGKLGLTLSTVGGVVTLVWPPTGVGLAAVLLYGHRMWPALVAGAFLTNVTSDAPVGFALATAIGNPLPPLVGAWLLSRADFDSAINRIKDVLVLIFLGALAPTTLSSSVGASGLFFTGMISGPDFFHTWLTWWLGDTLGVLMVAPVLLSLVKHPYLDWDRHQWVEALIWLLSFFCIISAVYHDWFDFSVTQTLIYLSFPLLIWPSLRFGTKETTLAALLIAYSAVWYTSEGAGPFTIGTMSERLGLLWSFMGAVTVTGLFLAAAMCERKRAIKDLENQRDRLENEVLARTADLSKMNATLVEEISERKQVNEKLRLQTQVIKQVHDSVISVDMDGIITSWNKGSERLFHFSAKEVLGRHVATVYPEESHEMLRKEIIPNLLFQGSLEMETTLIRKDGKAFDAMVSLSVLRNDSQEITGMIGYTLDNSERKQAERALADSERRLADIVEFLPDPTWVIDADGRVIAWNRAMERTTGIDKKEMIGKGNRAYAVPFYGKPRPLLIDLVLKRDSQWEKEYLTLTERDGLPVESESFHPSMGDGGRFFSEAAGRLYDAQGNIVGAIETLRDITTAKRTEQDRERLITELQDALTKVRTLSGLLPICASCKKIRNDEGYWDQIESFISKHSHAEFSHSICPECARKLYPDLDIYSE